MIATAETQYMLTGEAGPAGGERALMRAVLEDAMHCLAGEAGAAGERAELAAEARAWVESVDPRWPFSFENVCDGLGLETSGLRARLLRDVPASAPGDPRPLAERGTRPRRETPTEHEITRMIREGSPLRVVAQTFGISVSKASILSCGLASRMKAERDEDIRRLRAEGWTHRALAARFALSRIRVMRICAQHAAAKTESRTAA